VHVTDEGHIWALGRKYYEDPVAEFPGMRPTFEDTLVFEVSPGGETPWEISLLKLLYANDLISSLFRTGHGLIDGYTMSDVFTYQRRGDSFETSRIRAPTSPNGPGLHRAMPLCLSPAMQALVRQ
jgi:hypothetical protein